MELVPWLGLTAFTASVHTQEIAALKQILFQRSDNPFKGKKFFNNS